MKSRRQSQRLRGVSLATIVTQIAELLVSPKHRWKAFHSDELHEEQIGQTSPGLPGLTVLRLSASPHRVEEQETRE